MKRNRPAFFLATIGKNPNSFLQHPPLVIYNKPGEIHGSNEATPWTVSSGRDDATRRLVSGPSVAGAINLRPYLAFWRLRDESLLQVVIPLAVCHVAKSAEPLQIQSPDPEPCQPGIESSIQGIHARILLVFFQSALASDRLHDRFQLHSTESSSGDPALCTLSILRTLALDLVFILPIGSVQRDCQRREFDQENYFPGGSAALCICHRKYDSFSSGYADLDSVHDPLQGPIHDLLFCSFPLIIVIQLVLTLGFSLLVSSLSVHFRDLRDIIANLLTLWFFSTPIIYPLTFTTQQSDHFISRIFSKALYVNPLSYVMDGYHQAIFYGKMPDWRHLVIVFAGSLALFFFGYFVFDRLRDTFAEEV